MEGEHSKGLGGRKEEGMKGGEKKWTKGEK